jgi:hypothetical protein
MAARNGVSAFVAGLFAAAQIKGPPLRKIDA